MNVDKPLAGEAWGPFLIRILLGGYFLLAGLAKLEDLGAFIESVKSHSVMHDHIAAVYGVVLPYLEVAAGAALVIGFWTTLSASITAAMLASFIYAFGVFPVFPFNKDLILLAAALSLLCTGAGALSIDGFRKS